MPFKENSYGIVKRLQFIEDVIRDSNPANIADIGCGTGNYLTFPLAEKFEGIRFVGADTSPDSIKYARSINNLKNLEFVYTEDINNNDRFDLIIASEVIEHVENPEDFLLFLRKKLTDRGKILLTLPNGYGPFEIMSIVINLLHLSGISKIIKITGIYNIMKKIKYMLFGMPASNLSDRYDTLAVSPHINFFSYKEICNLFVKSGLKILQYRPRTFLCGFGFDQLLQGEHLINWNAKIADYLPLQFISDWIFVLEKGRFEDVGKYRHGMFARFHRYINRRAAEAAEKK